MHLMFPFYAIIRRGGPLGFLTKEGLLFWLITRLLLGLLSL